MSGVRRRIDEAVAVWRGREVTSGRLLLTAIGFLVLLLPMALYYLVVGPTAGDRLVAAGMIVAFVLLGLYSLWEAKAPGPPEGRHRRSVDDP